MTRKNKKGWKKEKPARPAILASLPPRLSALEAAGHPVGKAAKRKKKGGKQKGDSPGRGGDGIVVP